MQTVQALGDARAAEYMRGRKVLELNPDHGIIQALNENFKSDEGNAQVRSAGDRLIQNHILFQEC